MTKAKVRKAILSAICAASVALLGGGAAKASETAGDVVASCLVIIKSARHGADSDAYFAPTFESGRCWGAFAAVQQLGAVRERADAQPLLGFCIPEKERRTDVINAFVSFVKQNPSSASTSFAVTLVLAFRRLYPCDETRLSS
jgi:hypothetical protein